MVSQLSELRHQKVAYSDLAAMIYRSKSRLQTWCAPSSSEPLPMNERHHIWLAVWCEVCGVPPPVKKRRFGREKPLRGWTDEEDDFLKANYKDLTHAEMAQKLDRTGSAVQVRCGYLGLRKFQNWSAQREYTEADLVVVQNTTLKNVEVARLIGRSNSSVWAKRKRLGIESK